MSFPFFPLTSLKTVTVPVVKQAVSGAMAVASTVPLSLFVSGGIANAYTFPTPTNTFYQRFINATNGKLTAYDFQVVACNYYSNSPGLSFAPGNSLCNILTAQPGYWDTTQILYYRLYDCTAAISDSKIFVNFYGLQNQPRAGFQLATDSTGKILDPTNPGVPIAADVNACGSPVSNFTYPSWFTPGATSEKSIWFFPYQNATRWTKPTDNRSQAVAFFTYRTGDLSQPLTVNLSVSGTAQNGVDFDWSDPFNPAPGSPFGQLYFAPGRAVTNSILYARTVSQTTPEQTITLQMPIPTGYVSGGLDTFTGVFGPVTVPIVSVGNAGSSLTLTPGSTTEGFVITRSGNTDQPLTVTYSLSGTAQNGSDYSYLDGNLLFAANQTSVTIPITITPPSGSASVPSKTVTVTLQAGSTPGENQYNTTGTTTLNYTIPAYTPPAPTQTPGVTLSTTGATSLNPGASGSFTVTRTGDTSQPLTVSLNGLVTPQPSSSFPVQMPSTVTIPAGQATSTVNFTTAAGYNGTFIAALAPGEAYTSGTNTALSYRLGNGGVQVQVEYQTQTQYTSPAVITTTFDSSAPQFVVTRQVANPSDLNTVLTVPMNWQGTGVPGVDYAQLPNSVQFPAGGDRVTIPVTLLPGATGGRTITASVVPDTSSQYPSYLAGDGATGATFSIPGQTASTPTPAPAPVAKSGNSGGGSSAALPIVGGAAAVGGLAALASGGAAAAGAAGTGAVFGMLPQSCNAPSEFRAVELAKVIPAIQQQNPTWGNLRFASLPAPSSAGSMQVGGVRRAWNAGQPVDQIVRLGDVDGTFNVHCMNLEQIAKASGMGMNLANLTLKGTGLVKETTLVKLSTTVYSRASKVGDIPGMAQFLASKLGNSTVSADALNKLSLSEALKQYPKLADLDLGNLTLQQVPGVYRQAILADFPNWKEMQIAQVPGLRQVPFSQFPTLPRGDVRAAQ